MNDFIQDNFAIVDELSKENGRAEIKITCKDFDASQYGIGADIRGGQGSNDVINKVMERDILKRIADKMAEIPYEEIELFFDLFL